MMNNSIAPYFSLILMLYFTVQCVPQTPTGNDVDFITPDFQLQKPRVVSINDKAKKLNFGKDNSQNVNGYAIFDLNNGFDYNEHPLAITEPNGYYSSIRTNINAELQFGVASFIDLPSDIDINQLQSENAHLVSHILNNNTVHRIYSDTTRIKHTQDVSNIQFRNKEGALWIYWEHSFLSNATLQLSYAPDSISFINFGLVKLGFGYGRYLNFVPTYSNDLDGIFRFQVKGESGELSKSWDTQSSVLSSCVEDPSTLTAPDSLDFSTKSQGYMWAHILSFESISCFDYAILFEHASSEIGFKQVGWLDSSMSSITNFSKNPEDDYIYKIGFIRFGEPIVFTETISVSFNGNDWVHIND